MTNWNREGNRKPIALLSITQGDGHGSERVLGHFLRGWRNAPEDILILAPVDSQILNLSKELELPHYPLKTNRDALLRNFMAVEESLPGLPPVRLIHGWTARTFELAYWFRKRLNVPATATLHDHPLASFHTPLRQRMLRFFSNRLQALVCVSEAVRANCRQSGYRVPMQVIHNGLVETFPPHQVMEPEKPVRVGFLGMYSTGKGFSIVADWIAQTQFENLRWHLFGQPAEALQDQVNSISKRFPQQVSVRGQQLPEQIYSEIDILVHASTEFDSLPTVLIEAAQAGIPVVASCRGGAVEIVEQGKTGFLFDPQEPQAGLEALRRLVRDHGLRSNLGDAAACHGRARFSITRMVEAYCMFWDQISPQASTLCEEGIQ